MRLQAGLALALERARDLGQVDDRRGRGHGLGIGREALGDELARAASRCTSKPGSALAQQQPAEEVGLGAAHALEKRAQHDAALDAPGAAAGGAA